MAQAVELNELYWERICKSLNDDDIVWLLVAAPTLIRYMTPASDKLLFSTVTLSSFRGDENEWENFFSCIGEKMKRLEVSSDYDHLHHLQKYCQKLEYLRMLIRANGYQCLCDFLRVQSKLCDVTIYGNWDDISGILKIVDMHCEQVRRADLWIKTEQVDDMNSASLTFSNKLKNLSCFGIYGPVGDNFLCKVGNFDMLKMLSLEYCTLTGQHLTSLVNLEELLLEYCGGLQQRYFNELLITNRNLKKLRLLGCGATFTKFFLSVAGRLVEEGVKVLSLKNIRWLDIHDVDYDSSEAYFLQQSIVESCPRLEHAFLGKFWKNATRDAIKQFIRRLNSLETLSLEVVPIDIDLYREIVEIRKNNSKNPLCIISCDIASRELVKNSPEYAACKNCVELR